MGLFVSILSSLLTVNISLFLLLTFICSLCLHLFVYIYARLLCLPFELAEGSSPLRACGNESKIQKGGLIEELRQTFLGLRSCCRM